VLGSRTPERADKIVAGLGRASIRPGSYAQASAAEVVLPAMFLRDGMLDTLEPYRAAFDDKIVIDITNPFNDSYTDFILDWNTSGAEAFAHRFPRARLVGAFKNVWWEVFDAPEFPQGHSDVFVTGDDAAAKARFLELVEGFPFRFVDAGGLRNSRYVERMTLFACELGQRRGYFPRMNWMFLGEPWELGRADRVGRLIGR
jgi:hypothetical protein